jgi:hypothetical protein
MSDSVLATALALAARGHPVFPANWPIEHRGRIICSCRSELRGQPLCSKPAKHPYGILVPNGLLDASTESWQIKLWWQKEPQANLAMECSGLVVVDADPNDGGDESLRALEREHGELPLTWRSLTGGGGTHDIYKAPDGVDLVNVVAKQMTDPPLGRGVDIRTKGGFIITPPSLHVSGRRYEWSVDHHPKYVELAPAPPWLIERLTKVHSATGTIDANGAPIAPISSDIWAQLTRQPITKYQDMAAARIAGHFFRHSCDYQLVLGMLHAWNSAWCKPPIPYRELERIVGRIAVREAQRIQKGLGQ